MWLIRYNCELMTIIITYFYYYYYWYFGDFISWSVYQNGKHTLWTFFLSLKFMFKVMNINMVSIWTCLWFIEQRFCNWDLVAYTIGINFDDVDKNGFFVSFIIMIGQNYSCFNVHVFAKNAVSNKVEMRNGTVFQNNRCFYFATDSDFCPWG